MSYATIGLGNIGRALAKAFARMGTEVSVAATRDPESFAGVTNTICHRQSYDAWRKSNEY